MTDIIATSIGVLLQLIGAGYLVFQTYRTSAKLGAYQAQVTYDNLGATIETLARELGSQFKQQLVGFVFVFAGSGLQLYAAVAA